MDTYTDYEKTIFTNRKKEIKNLDFMVRELLENGMPVHYNMFGQRRIGKTLLIKHFMHNCLKTQKLDTVYVDFENLSPNPHFFIQQLFGSLCKNLIKDHSFDFSSYKTLPDILNKISSHGILVKQGIELQRILDSSNKMDYGSMFHFVLSTLVYWAKEHDKYVIAIFDEFQNIEYVQKFANTENILGNFRDFLNMDRLRFIISGSLISKMLYFSSNAASPLFNQLTNLSVDMFSKKNSIALVNKIISIKDERILFLLNSITSGHPFYLVELAKALKTANFNNEISETDCKRVFLNQLFDRNSPICNHCNYVYSISLKRTTSYTQLKTILDIISVSAVGLNQSEIGRKLGVTQGTARNYLNDLVDVDLLFRKQDKYYFRDSILKYWVATSRLGQEAEFMPSEKTYQFLINQLDEKFQNVSQELGTLKELELKNLIERIHGKTVKINNEKIKIPKFDEININYKPDKKTETDLFAQGYKQKWAFELKWKNQKVDANVILFLKSKIKADKYIIVSKAGFTKKAIVLGRDDDGVMLWGKTVFEM